MNFLDVFMRSPSHEARPGRITGVVIAVVTNNQDPDGLGRVKVRFPWLSDADESAWARVATLMAGNQRGTYFLPEVEDEVLVAFEQGDLRFPYVIGALWNGKDAPPAKNKDGKNNVRLIKSRSGHMIRLNDEAGKETIEIVDKTGKNSLMFDAASNTLTIATEKDIVLSATKGTIRLEAQKLELKSSADTKVDAGAGMDLKASGQMTVQGATVNIN
jgi:uncharacterized protein involved in type VI secretion and phage assembly